MALEAFPDGNYRYLTGIAPYCRAVVADPGFEIVHATLRRPVPYRSGFEVIERWLEASDRPRTALCGVELRSPSAMTFDEFAAFNREYLEVLDGWGLLTLGVNPVARTNVAPLVRPPHEPSLFGFSYTAPCPPEFGPTFLLAGAGELPEGVLDPSGLVRPGETSADALLHKAAFVMDLLDARLAGVGATFEDVGVVNAYTIHPLGPILADVVLPRLGSAASAGVHWHLSRPPILDIEYEMDARSVRLEIRVG